MCNNGQWWRQNRNFSLPNSYDKPQDTTPRNLCAAQTHTLKIPYCQLITYPKSNQFMNYYTKWVDSGWVVCKWKWSVQDPKFKSSWELANFCNHGMVKNHPQTAHQHYLTLSPSRNTRGQHKPLTTGTSQKIIPGLAMTIKGPQRRTAYWQNRPLHTKRYT